MSHQSDEDIHKGRNISLGTPRSRCDFVCDIFFLLNFGIIYYPNISEYCSLPKKSFSKF